VTQPYATVHLFFSNADAHAAFLARVAARLIEWAIEEREKIPASPDAQQVARQSFAVAVLSGQAGATVKAGQLLPALAVKANDAGLIAADGTIEATDQQIAAVISDSLVDLHTTYIPEAA
jgi:hypothetical protein